MGVGAGGSQESQNSPFYPLNLSKNNSPNSISNSILYSSSIGISIVFLYSIIIYSITNSSGVVECRGSMYSTKGSVSPTVAPPRGRRGRAEADRECGGMGQKSKGEK